MSTKICSCRNSNDQTSFSDADAQRDNVKLIGEIHLMSYEIMTEEYFCVCHKSRQKHKQHFNCYFSK